MDDGDDDVDGDVNDDGAVALVSNKQGRGAAPEEIAETASKARANMSWSCDH
jgi:hypothetical protein